MLAVYPSFRRHHQFSFVVFFLQHLKTDFYSLATCPVFRAQRNEPGSPAHTSLEKSVTAIQDKGYSVSVLKPDKLNEDFNDVLKNQGPQGVREILERNLSEGNLSEELIKIAPHKKEAPLGPLILKSVMLDKSTFEEKSLEKKAVEDSIQPPNKFVEKAPSVEDVSLKKEPKLPTGEMVFEELTQTCIRKLYADLGEERRDLTSDLIKDSERQAERAANFIFHAHTMKGTRPTAEQTKQFLERAKYELDRIPKLRDELVHQWKKVNSYNGEKDELIAHMIAERQASVEGRMYSEAIERGLSPSSKIPEHAKEEIKKNKATTITLAEQFKTKQRLSQSAASFCAKDIVRYMETHGQKPSAEQMSAMAQISRDLEKQGYDPSIGIHTIEYLRRKDGDLRLRDWSASHKDLSGFKYFPHAIQDYAHSPPREKVDEKEQLSQIQETHEKVYEMDFSM